jgi:hypothetical protein
MTLSLNALAAPLAGGTVYPGIAELLEALSRRLPLVAVTNKPTPLARAVLDAAGLLPYLQAVHGADEPALQVAHVGHRHQAIVGAVHDEHGAADARQVRSQRDEFGLQREQFVVGMPQAAREHGAQRPAPGQPLQRVHPLECRVQRGRHQHQRLHPLAVPRGDARGHGTTQRVPGHHVGAIVVGQHGAGDQVGLFHEAGDRPRGPAGAVARPVDRHRVEARERIGQPPAPP